MGGMLRAFGLGGEIGEGKGEVVVVKVCDSEDVRAGEDREKEMETVRAELKEWVEGTAVVFGEESLLRVSDVEGVRRRYKLGGGGKGGAVRVEGGGGGKEAKLERRRRRKEGGEGEAPVGGGEGAEEKAVAVEGAEGGNGGGGGVREGVKGEKEYGEDERRELEMQVLGLMALRGAV